LSNNLKKLIIESIKDQRDIFGDDLFQSLERPKKHYPQKEKGEMKVSEKIETDNSSDLFAEPFQKAKNVDELYDMIHECQKCALGKTRTKFVFGVGNPDADALLIGEAPGAEEDKQGIPFVGRAGKLLTDILKAIDLERDDVYIANMLKCRPPNNRDPLPSEMETCRPYLNKQIDLIKPKVILCLGRVAGAALLKKNMALKDMRGNVFEVEGVKVMVTYHPAALLRNPNWKKGCWEDVKKFKKLYDELTGSN
jgi:DNA polymerase